MGEIILKPIQEPRKNWEDTFKKMNAENDDELLMNDVLNEEIFEEWN